MKSIITAFLIVASLYGIYHTTDRILTAQLTKGPYEVTADETDKYNRSNITENQTGLPVQYVITIVDDNNNALPGVRLDTWFANAAGKYSGIASIGTADENFLRGWQLTDANGQLTFYGIFPGPYTGRTIHAHFRAREYLANGTVIYNNTTQLFFLEDIIDEVMALEDYQAAAAANWNTQNDKDQYYTTENLLNVTGNTTTGYVATYTIVLPLRNTAQSTNDDDAAGGAGGAGGPPGGFGGSPPSGSGRPRCLRSTSRSRLLTQFVRRGTSSRRRRV